jgi:hypothetical protein
MKPAMLFLWVRRRSRLWTGLTLGLVSILAGIAATVPTRITWASLRVLERTADSSFEALVKDDPLSILGNTRGVYLQGYGVVFSTEVELSPSSAPNPFRPAFNKEEIARLKEKKKIRMSFLKESMRNVLLHFAKSLNAVPQDENVALAVTIPYFRWEDIGGMPRQILMVAPRKALIAQTVPANAVTLQEFY